MILVTRSPVQIKRSLIFAGEMGKENKYQLLPRFAVKVLGLFIPFLKEIYEMRYQYDRDYFFDSSKFENYFNFKPTLYRDGIKETVKRMQADIDI